MSKAAAAAAAAGSATTAAAAAPFTFPPFYSFPPFFTVQPVEQTWQKQRALWLDLIRSYAAHHRLSRINLQLYRPASTAAAQAVAAAASSASSSSAAAAASASSGSSKDAALVTSLFRNAALDRALSLDSIRLLLDALAAEGWGVWEDAYAGSSRCLFLLSPSLRLAEIADAIHSHIQSIGEALGLFTLYELCNGDLMKPASAFYRMDEALVLAACRLLESKGRCALMHAPVLSETGIKFLG